MARSNLVLLACFIFLMGATGAHPAVVEHTFNVATMTMNKLCTNTVVTAVNGEVPGPAIYANEGDRIIVHVINNSSYNVTIHWHGVIQLLSAWADGPNYITQCPIVPGNRYTYNFTVPGQEGTIWWHAHVGLLRATLYGAIIIRPKPTAAGVTRYPFPTPYKEVPIILGEWWNANVVDVGEEAYLSGSTPNNSDAFTINGKPGDLYNCSTTTTTTVDMFKLDVVYGKTYMLRIINAAINNQLFFMVAGHNFTVVATDANYATPYHTDTLVLASGHSIDALMVADAADHHHHLLYYMAARAYITKGSNDYDNTTTTGIVQYYNNYDDDDSAVVISSSAVAAAAAIMPSLPDYRDTATAHQFYSNLTGLVGDGRPQVPKLVNHRMFVTVGLSIVPCAADQTSCNGTAFSANMNNVSFVTPSNTSMLEAYYNYYDDHGTRAGVEGVYTRDFPNRPPTEFDYTNTDSDVSQNETLLFNPTGTKVKSVKYNSTVEMVLQDTSLVNIENHPIHIHGFNFFVLAQGFGNYDKAVAKRSYNLVNPQLRNTIAVPTGGWAVIRFKADNPGIWFMHCHLDEHLSWGMAMAFEVKNGRTASSRLPPPPPDLPTC